MQLSYNPKLRKKILKYSFRTLSIVWISAFIGVVYQYFLSVAEFTESKGWTFVEGIFWPTSFLPYIGETAQSNFYQGLLFKSCLNYDLQQQGSFVENICSVSTSNNKDFRVNLYTGFTWSDGTPLTVDDILFTFQELIIRNQRNIENLNIYNSATVNLESDGSIKVIFPKSSTDNILFFTNYILPKHILQNQDLSYYKEEFGNKPIYANCASIKPQNTDTNSLIFDLTKCSDSRLGFYQVKNYNTFEDFLLTTNNPNTNIVDAYLHPTRAPEFEDTTIHTNTYSVMFFNTQSPKLLVRLRRSLAGFINTHFSDYSDQTITSDRRIFDKFLTDGNTIQEFITRITPDNSLDIKDLQESNVKQLPNTITFDEKTRKFVYYVQKKPSNTQVDIKRDNDYTNMRVKHNDRDIGAVANLSTKNKTAKFTIPANTITWGLNTYTIYTKKDDKDINIGSITIYYFTEQKGQIQENEKLVILYQNTPSAVHIVQILQNIFSANNIADFFIRQMQESNEQMQEALTEGNYDIAILNITKGQRRDISPILKSEDPTVNPSQYNNGQLSTLFEQYLQNSNTNTAVTNQIQNIYSNDAPFVFLGKLKETAHIKANILNSVRASFTGELYEYNRRQAIYHYAQITQNLHLNTNQNVSLQGFWNFINPKQDETNIEIETDKWSIYKQYIN